MESREKFSDSLLNEMGSSAPKGIDEFVLQTVFLMFVIFMLVFPFIYIGNNIYLASLELDRNKVALMVLQDENQQLKRELQVNSFFLK